MNTSMHILFIFAAFFAHVLFAEESENEPVFPYKNQNSPNQPQFGYAGKIFYNLVNPFLGFSQQNSTTNSSKTQPPAEPQPIAGLLPSPFDQIPPPRRYPSSGGSGQVGSPNAAGIYGQAGFQQNQQLPSFNGEILDGAGSSYGAGIPGLSQGGRGAFPQGFGGQGSNLGSAYRGQVSQQSQFGQYPSSLRSSSSGGSQASSLNPYGPRGLQSPSFSNNRPSGYGNSLQGYNSPGQGYNGYSSQSQLGSPQSFPSPQAQNQPRQFFF